MRMERRLGKLKKSLRGNAMDEIDFEEIVEEVRSFCEGSP